MDIRTIELDAVDGASEPASGLSVEPANDTGSGT
jgi:hypothetical protein